MNVKLRTLKCSRDGSVSLKIDIQNLIKHQNIWIIPQPLSIIQENPNSGRFVEKFQTNESYPKAFITTLLSGH